MAHFETSQPISVVLDLRVADVRITAAEGSDAVVHVRPADPADRDDVSAAERTRVEYADGRLLVKGPRRLREWSPFSDGGAIEVEIELPTGSDLTGRTVAGGFRCSGALGRCELRSSAGQISLDEAGAVKLATAGDISLRRCTGDAELTTATGDVRAGEIAGSAVVKSANGDTRIGQIGGELRVKAANGDIDVTSAGASVSAKTANGHITVGRVHRGALVAETATGHIQIGVAAGVTAWLDLNTRFGRVRNELDAADGPDAAEEQVQLRAITGFGDITIRREAVRADGPAGSAADA